MGENKCQGCPNYKENHYTTGLFECCSNGCEKEIRADERAKTMTEMHELLKRIGGHFFAVDGEIYYKARDVFDIFEQKGEN